MANFQILMEHISSEEMEIAAIAAQIVNFETIGPGGVGDEGDILLRAVTGIEMDDNDLLEVHPRGDPAISIKNYFEEVIPLYTIETFRSHFRMSRATVCQLENIIRPHVHARTNNDGTKTMPLLKKILLTIWVLATNETFRSVSERFGVTRTDGHHTFVEILLGLIELLPEYVKWPTANACNASEAIFEQRQSSFTGVVGAMDGCHIRITQPPGNSHDYYNRHDHHSINLQATCDHSGKFIDVLIGRPGRAHDAAVFRSSPLYARLTDEQNPLLPPNQHILADSAYPLLLNVLTPFRDNGHLTNSEKRFNAKHASLRSIIERSFGLLKVKWQRLLYCLNVKSVRMGNMIITACCVLHNFLLLHNDADILEGMNVHEIGGEEIDDDDDVMELNALQKRRHIMNSL